MIFVTVGTHEQPFDRLMREIDRLKSDGTITEEVVVQTGYCTFEPRFCECHKMLSYDEMNRFVNEARIVITHGGPASFIAPLSIGKTPVVVPRQKAFGEHVNDHQFDFANELVNRGYNLIVVNDIALLGSVLKKYDSINGNQDISFNNDSFVKELDSLIRKLFD